MSTPQPARECPRWPRCSVNRCPLDPHMTHPDDKEKVCTMEKRVRQRIGAKYPELLPMGGLTSREHLAAKRWASLSSAEKSAIAERGRQALHRSRTNQTPDQPQNDKI